MTPRYVYGVLASAAAVPEIAGIAGAPLELVDGEGIAALVSEVPAEELRMGREEMTAHARVLEDAHALGPVLPMRFGVVMAGDEEVRDALLGAHRQDLATQLAEFADKAELRLRATYDEDTLLREVVLEDREIAELRSRLRGAPEDATYYLRIRLGELISQAIERKRELDGQRILAELSPLAIAVDIAEPSHERVAFSASFLVGRAEIEGFDGAVDRVGEAQAGRMRLRYTGPLPPHSFVRLAAVA